MTIGCKFKVRVLNDPLVIFCSLNAYPPNLGARSNRWVGPSHLRSVSRPPAHADRRRGWYDLLAERTREEWLFYHANGLGEVAKRLPPSEQHCSRSGLILTDILHERKGRLRLPALFCPGYINFRMLLE